ncbi:polysaccharide biosynthesis C-terminal domain-containing protein [Hazenella sp. IB182353]|uniref:lipopolysaccharide biosynthesis protein n=1 Tax=Polycladospora coralii TaxID=2771432 RepID=UPI001746A466|nr:polysaccharide biosynthesis C-terminal domain-containing protein [Polycladospora coralii]MBS7530679.1 polysaccharide biosynthesis C-terminal domain-containing protein [Polycladospora coralii]
MKTLLKKLFSDSAAFAVAMFGNKLVALILVPIWFKYLDNEAIWGTTNAYTLILTYLCVLGTDAAMAFYFYDSKNEEERRTYFFNAIFFSVSICVGFGVFTFFAGEPLGILLYASNEYNQLLFIATLATIGAIIIQHVLGYARYSGRVWLFNTFSMAYVIGSNLISVIFVINGFGVMGLFYGQLIGQSLVAIILLFLFRKEFVFKLSKAHISDLIRYGLPLLPTLISFWVLTSVSRPIVLHLSSMENANIMEASIRVAAFIVLITAPFQLAWRPFSMSIKEREDAPEVFGVVARLLLVVGTLSIMLLTFVIEPLYKLYISEADKATGYLYVWPLALGTLFNVLHTVFGVGLLIKKQTKKISRSFMIASIIYFIGVFLTVPSYGIWGAVSMTTVAYLVVIILVYRQNQKVYPVQFHFKAMMIYLTVYLVSMVGISWIQTHQYEYKWVYYMTAIVITILTIFITKLIPVQSLGNIRKILPKLGGKG